MKHLEKVVYVVEGKNDYSKLKSIFPNANIVMTNGSEISEVTLFEIQKLSSNNRIVLLLDPDGPGEKIRKVIVNKVPDVEHVFVDKEKAISSNKKKVGIEHMKTRDIIDALKHIKKPIRNYEITRLDLFDLLLIGHDDSSRLRESLCSELGIGMANGRTLLNKLNMFGYSLEEIKESILKVRI